jgi:hypothetical protein
VGGLVAAPRPVADETKVVGHEAAVVGFEVVVGPLDDDPPQFAERVLELDLNVGFGQAVPNSFGPVCPT